MPDSFTPVVPALEDGGERDFSRTRDWRVNLKLGYTPNDTDEYAISYTRQAGAKNAPLHVSDTVSAPRFWNWPKWDIDSVYFLSTTALGDRATLKTRAYYNQFDSMLRSFNDRTQSTQSRPFAFDSPYFDKAWGGSAQLDLRMSDADTLRLALHYRHDKHVEAQAFLRPSRRRRRPRTPYRSRLRMSSHCRPRCASRWVEAASRARSGSTALSSIAGSKMPSSAAGYYAYDCPWVVLAPGPTGFAITSFAPTTS